MGPSSGVTPSRRVLGMLEFQTCCFRRQIHPERLLRLRAKRVLPDDCLKRTCHLSKPSACPARVRCCRRLIPTPIAREDRTHAWGPVTPGTSPCRKPLLQSLRDRQGSDRERSRPGTCRESRLLRAWESRTAGLHLWDSLKEVHLRRALCCRPSPSRRGKGCDFKAGFRRAPWAASAQGPCARVAP